MAAHVTIGGIDYPVIFDPPGETSNILQQQEIEEPALLKLYAVLEGDANPDRYITFENLVKYLFPKASLRVGTKNVTVGSNQIIFKVGGIDTPFATLNYAFIPTKGYELGLSDLTKYVECVTFEAMEPGTMDYIAILFT
jgi:hypothetical protein